MRELRAQARIPVTERASLNSGETWFPCVVQNMSDNGFLLLCTKPVQVGQVLDFKCELFPGKSVACKIEIKHVGEAVIGTKILEMDRKGHDLVQLYLQEQYSLKLNRSS